MNSTRFLFSLALLFITDAFSASHAARPDPDALFSSQLKKSRTPTSGGDGDGGGFFFGPGGGFSMPHTPTSDGGGGGGFFFGPGGGFNVPGFGPIPDFGKIPGFPGFGPIPDFGKIPGFPGFGPIPDLGKIPGFGGFGGFGNGVSGGYGGGYGGPSGGYGNGGVVRPTVTCMDRGPCYKKQLQCPAKCFTSYSWSGTNSGGGGGGGGCTMDCKEKCEAYC